jgi:hypothetical protein
LAKNRKPEKVGQNRTQQKRAPLIRRTPGRDIKIGVVAYAVLSSLATNHYALRLPLSEIPHTEMASWSAD